MAKTERAASGVVVGGHFARTANKRSPASALLQLQQEKPRPKTREELELDRLDFAARRRRALEHYRHQREHYRTLPLDQLAKMLRSKVYNARIMKVSLPALATGPSMCFLLCESVKYSV